MTQSEPWPSSRLSWGDYEWYGEYLLKPQYQILQLHSDVVRRGGVQGGRYLGTLGSLGEERLESMEGYQVTSPLTTSNYTSKDVGNYWGLIIRIGAFESCFDRVALTLDSQRHQIPL